jgi:hypothetical protein
MPDQLPEITFRGVLVEGLGGGKLEEGVVVRVNSKGSRNPRMMRS